MTIGQLEAWLREGFIQTHKELTGRGPRDTYIRIFRNTIVFHMEDVLTPLENRLLSSTGAEAEIKELRVRVLELMMPQISESIKRKLNCEVIDSIISILPEYNLQYGMLILDKDLEKSHISVG